MLQRLILGEAAPVHTELVAVRNQCGESFILLHHNCTDDSNNPSEVTVASLLMFTQTQNCN